MTHDDYKLVEFTLKREDVPQSVKEVLRYISGKLIDAEVFLANTERMLSKAKEKTEYYKEKCNAA